MKLDDYAFPYIFEENNDLTLLTIEKNRQNLKFKDLQPIFMIVSICFAGIILAIFS